MKKWMVVVIACAIAIGSALFIRHWAHSNDNDFEEELFVAREPFDPDAPGNQLIEAVRVGDMERVVQLLEAGADPNWVFEDSGPPLVTAVLADQIEMIPALLEYGADTSVQDADERTAYYYGSHFYGNNPILNNLLRLKVKITVPKPKLKSYAVPAA